MKPKTVSQMFPSKWLKAEDLKGKSVILTIKHCAVEKVRNPLTSEEEYKAILDFGRSKRLILNKTQCAALVAITGSEAFQDWENITILLMPSRARNGKPTINIMSAPETDPPATGAPIAEIDEDAPEQGEEE